MIRFAPITTQAFTTINDFKTPSAIGLPLRRLYQAHSTVSGELMP